MRYAFVFVSIVAMWLALIMLALASPGYVLFVTTVVIIMTVVLFLIGFQRGR